MAAKHAVARFAANDNDDENDNFHMEVNYQFSIIHYQFAAPQHCHATPKMNFFHLGIFIYFANSEIAISAILLVQSKKYFSLITILLYAEKS